jgi:hypothetical protein
VKNFFSIGVEGDNQLNVEIGYEIFRADRDHKHTYALCTEDGFLSQHLETRRRCETFRLQPTNLT